MKLSKIDIESYQGIGFMALEIEQPVLLVSGKNGAGKSSLRDAVEFAVTGHSSRVSLKKDYPKLVRVGADAKKAKVSVELGGFKFARKVSTGKGETPDFPAVLPHLLGSKLFADLDHKTRAALLFGVTGTKRDKKEITRLLVERKVESKCIDLVMPILNGGFAAGVKFCKDKQSECRGAWEAVTSDRFGASKAEDWVAPAINLDAVKALEAERDELAEARPRIAQEVADLTDAAALHIVNAQIEGAVYKCPDCAEEVRLVGGKLVMNDAPEQVEETPFEERQKCALDLGVARKELHGVQDRITVLSNEIGRIDQANKERTERTKKATVYFARFQHWGKAVDALSPGGVPLQLLEAGLKPINERLKVTAGLTGWKDIVISPDLTLSYDGIPYGLCSESEQWRVDTALVEAFSLLSATKMFMIDRFDVLHPSDRGTVINWLVHIHKEHDTIVLLGTLKNPPKGLPPMIQTVWLRDGGAIEP